MPSPDPKRRKMLEYQRRRGNGYRMTAEEAVAAHRKVIEFHAAGMSFRSMAKVSGVAQSTLTVFARQGGNGTNSLGGTTRATYNALMAMEFVAPPVTPGRYGARGACDPIPAARRVVALRVNGWPVQTLIELLPVYNASNIHKLCSGQQKEIGIHAYQAISELYDKLRDVDPVEWGVTPRQARVARAYVKGRPGTECWDWDTIDDPGAVAEWTGACGTEEGYRIHIRETVFNSNPIPLCDACREIVETRPSIPPKVILNRHNLADALSGSPLTVKAIARQVFGEDKADAGRDTLYRWRDGTRGPRYAGQVQLLADALDVDIAYLMNEDAMRQAADRAVIGNGRFNPYVLRVALEMAALSFNAAARLPGARASSAAIAKWANGEMSPLNKDKLKPIADYFGVDVNVFYA